MYKRVLVVLAVLAFAALLPGAVAAQGPDGEEPDDVLIRINGPIHIQAGETAAGIVVISDDAVIEGTIDFLAVIDGNATVSGTVRHTVTVVNGTLTLTSGARVEEDALLYRANAVLEPGATVVGDVREEWGGFTVSRGLWFGFWLSMTIAVVVAGLLFAAFGARQITGAGQAVSHDVGPTVLGAVILWIGVPVLAVVAMMTVVGIPLGLGILLFLLPALWFVGYIVAGAAVGMPLVARMRPGGADGHPYLAVVVGLLIFQLIVLLPFIGGTIAFVAGLVGAGALVYRAWAAFRGTVRPAAALPPATAAPPA